MQGQTRLCRIKLRQPLNSEQENKLIAQFKGFVQSVKTDLIKSREKVGNRSKLINQVGFIKNLGIPLNLDIVKTQIDMLLTETIDSEGVSKTYVEQYFEMNKEENGYIFKYPYMSALLGLGKVSSEARKHGLSVKFMDKQMFREFCKEAGIENQIESLEIEDGKTEQL